MNKYTFLANSTTRNKESISDVNLVFKHISDPKVQDGRRIWIEDPFF